MIELKKYCCIIRTYTLDDISIGGITNDKVRIEQCNERGQDSSIVYGADVIEFDYFNNEQEKEARNEYLRLLIEMGAEVRS